MDEVSKSQRKREVEALQALAIKIAKLPTSQLQQLPLPVDLLEAIEEYKRLKSNGAIRRQAQFLGRVMRDLDVAPIKAALERIQAQRETKTGVFHETEQWVERLMTEGPEALTAFVAQYPEIELPRLRSFIKSAIQDHQQETNTGGHKTLHRFIHEFLTQKS